ncbi:MAG: Lrp/AsnC family transcriptional regulator [Promethearchaeota archaeon]
MLKAFVMIKLKSKTFNQAIEAIKKMQNVVRIATVTGEFDLLVEFSGEDTDALHKFHFHLDSLEYIEGVITNVVMKEFEP